MIKYLEEKESDIGLGFSPQFPVKQMDGRTNRQMDRRTDGHMAEEEKDRWKEVQTEGITDGLMDRRIDR